MNTDGRCCLQIPRARVMLLQSLVRKDARGAYFYQIAAELILQHAVLMAAKIDMVMCAKYLQGATAGIITIEANTAVAGDTAIHFVIDERPQILIAMGCLLEAKCAVIVAGQDGHVLQVPLAAFIAHGAVMGMVYH